MEIVKKLRFTINDGDVFPLPLSVQSLRFGNRSFSLNKRRDSFLSSIREAGDSRRLSLTLSQQEQTILVVDEAMSFRHLGHALLVQKGLGDNQTLWFEGVEGFPPAIIITYGMREHVLRDGNEVFIYAGNVSDELTIKLPTNKVHFRVSNNWKAEVIG